MDNDGTKSMEGFGRYGRVTTIRVIGILTNEFKLGVDEEGKMYQGDGKNWEPIILADGKQWQVEQKPEVK